MLSKPSVLGSGDPPASFGRYRKAVRALSRWYLLNSRLRRFLASTNSPEHRGIPRCPPRPSLSHHANGGQNLTIEWNVRSGRCDKTSKNGFGHKDDSQATKRTPICPPRTTHYAKHAALKTCDVCRKKIGPHFGRCRDARQKSHISEQVSHSSSGLINTQQPQSISNNHKRDSRRLTRMRKPALFALRRRVEGKCFSSTPACRASRMIRSNCRPILMN